MPAFLPDRSRPTRSVCASESSLRVPIWLVRSAYDDVARAVSSVAASSKLGGAARLELSYALMHFGAVVPEGEFHRLRAALLADGTQFVVEAHEQATGTPDA